MADARDTKKQENGSRIVFESVIEYNKFPTTQFIKSKAYPEVSEKWIRTYKLQSEILKQYLKGNRGYNYSRDQGIMPIIEKLASTKMGVSKKDAWNPMDIVLVKKQGEITIRKKIEEIANTEGLIPKDKLIRLNLYMKKLLKSKVMIPISLKEIKQGVKKASIEESNIGAKSKGVKFSIIPKTVFCDLDMSKPPLFDTGEFTFKMKVEDEIVKVQIRSFRYSKPSTVIQTDLTPLGRQSGAKLGKTASDAIVEFLNKFQLQRPLTPTQDPMIAVDGKFNKRQIDFWDKLYKEIKNKKIEGESIDFDAPLELGKKTATLKQIIEYALKSKEKDRNVLGRLFSKLVTLKWIKIYQIISQKKKFEEWLSVLYYGAKKEFSDINGPFIKIY